MRKIVSMVCLVGLVSVLFLSSCEQDDSPDNLSINFSKVNVKIKVANNGSSTVGSLGEQGMADSIIFDEASMGVSSLTFQAEDSIESDSTDADSTDVEEEDAKVEGPFTFNLVAGSTTPDFDATTGPYEGIVVKLAPILTDGNSILVDFDLTSDTDTTAVEFSSNTRRAFVIKPDSTIEIDGSSSQVLVLLQISKLFEGIDFSTAMADEDGVIRINESSNKSLYNKINSNLSRAFKAGEDNDEDGDIDE